MIELEIVAQAIAQACMSALATNTNIGVGIACAPLVVNSAVWKVAGRVCSTGYKSQQ